MGTRKRANGEGSVYRRKSDGLWIGAVTFRSNNGKLHRKTISSRTKAEAAQKLHTLRSNVNNGLLSEPSSLTVSDYLKGWLKDVAAHRVRETTFTRYEGLLRVHAYAYFGTSLRLQSLTPVHLQQFYRSLLDAGHSKRTAEFMHVVLKSAFKHAVRMELISRNPSDMVDKPKTERACLSVLEPEDVRKFLVTAESDRLYALYVLALILGPRYGEIAALKWGDLNAAGDRLRIERTARWFKGGKFKTGPTKTARGRRTLHLPDIAIKALKQHKEAAEDSNPDTLIFQSEDGSPIGRYEVTDKLFPALLKKAGVPHIRFHDCRHSAITIMLLRGVEVHTVSQMVGHASPSFTLNQYAHVLNENRRLAAETLNDFYK